jgi:hypothetical protein
MNLLVLAQGIRTDVQPCAALAFALTGGTPALDHRDVDRTSSAGAHPTPVRRPSAT